MLDTSWLLLNGTILFEVIGTLAFALSGLIEAARKKLDLVGMAMVSGLAAFGGGTLRDILLDRRPFFWVENEIWVWILILICIGALLFMRSRHLAHRTRNAVARCYWPWSFHCRGNSAGVECWSAGRDFSNHGCFDRYLRRCASRHSRE